MKGARDGEIEGAKERKKSQRNHFPFTISLSEGIWRMIKLFKELRIDKRGGFVETNSRCKMDVQTEFRYRLTA